MTGSDWVGRTLAGRYRIVELLGAGEMSTVYKAEDANLKRFVAVKVIQSDPSADPSFVTRFEETASALAQIRHSNIIQVYDFNHEGEFYYLVMEYIPGETLRDHLKRITASGRYMAFVDIVNTAINICEAAAVAHRAGFIHNKINPANIMLNLLNDQAVLLDPGIHASSSARRHAADQTNTAEVQYMAPEQIQRDRPDERADLYAIGLTLFEMVTGRPPFEADSAMTLMMMHLKDPIPDLRQFRPDVPPTLAAVVEKALAKKRDTRFQTAAEMAGALRAVLDQVTSGAQNVSALPHTAVREGHPIPTPVPVTAVGTAHAGHPAAPASTPGKPVWRAHPSYFAIGGILVLLLALGGFMLSRLFGGGGNPPEQAVLPTNPTSFVIVVITETTPTPEPSQTSEPTLTNTPGPPTETPTPSLTPSITAPPGVLFVRINDITIENGRYLIAYETFEYQEVLPGMHVHFYYDTVSEQNAGSPGSGPWILWGGPRPFDGYTVSSRPAGATQMCARVANPDHSIHRDSGNCFPLPEG